MELVDIVDTEVRHVAVIAKLAGGGNVRASAEHECDLTGATETPVTRVDVVDFAAEHVAIPGAGQFQIMNGENRIRPGDSHELIVPPEGAKHSGLDALRPRRPRRPVLEAVISLLAGLGHDLCCHVIAVAVNLW
jgi:hypothetical protein